MPVAFLFKCTNERLDGHRKEVRKRRRRKKKKEEKKRLTIDNGEIERVGMIPDFSSQYGNMNMNVMMMMMMLMAMYVCVSRKGDNTVSTETVLNKNEWEGRVGGRGGG